MWFKKQDQEVILKIIAKPNARRTLLLRINDQGLHIAIHAKPHDGEANIELITYLAKLFRVPKSCIILKKGETSRHKLIAIPFSEAIQTFLDEPDRFIEK